MAETFTGNREQITLFILGQTDTEALWDITPHKDVKRRSLDSNAYFHVLCDKLRQKLKISMARCKNHLIADYGQIEYIDGQPMIYKTNAPEEYMMELETLHSKCVKVSEENDKPVFFYRIYRPSHTYNSKEFYQLLQGTIEECKAQGIETATPSELAEMQRLWEQRYGKRMENNP